MRKQMTQILTLATAAIIVVASIHRGEAVEPSDAGVAYISTELQPIPEPDSTHQESPTYQDSNAVYYYEYEPQHHSSHRDPFTRVIGQFSIHSPDHGWSFPERRPIYRRGVEYQRYWPNQWYGQRTQGLPRQIPNYPMVSMPTDTTQLGYYYKQVPHWRPNPRMLPPVPKPWLFHTRYSGGPMSRSWRYARPTVGVCPHCGQIHPEGTSQPGNEVPPAPKGTSPRMQEPAPRAMNNSNTNRQVQPVGY